MLKARRRRDAIACRAMDGFTGFNGFNGFNGLFGEGPATGQACMVHVRRKFVNVFERDGSLIARGAIERIAQLCAVEREARYKSPDERARGRRRRGRFAMS